MHERFTQETHFTGGSEMMDSDPDFYRTNTVISRAEVIDNLLSGMGASISVDMSNYTIYIGRDHATMQLANRIQPENLCAAHVYYDKDSKHIRITGFSDWRNGCKDNPVARTAITKALERDLFEAA